MFIWFFYFFLRFCFPSPKATSLSISLSSSQMPPHFLQWSITTSPFFSFFISTSHLGHCKIPSLPPALFFFFQNFKHIFPPLPSPTSPTTTKSPSAKASKSPRATSKYSPHHAPCNSTS